MNNGGGNGGSSFEVEHGSDAVEVTNVHEAGEALDIVTERLIRIKSNTKIARRGIRGQSRGRRVSGKVY